MKHFAPVANAGREISGHGNLEQTIMVSATLAGRLDFQLADGLPFPENRSMGVTVTTSAPPVSADSLLDFTDRWPPMLVKELRQGLRAYWFVVPFLLLHLLVLAAVAVEYLLLRDPAAGGALRIAAGEPGIFWITVYIIVAGIMPLRGMESLREESARGNAELLLLGGLSRWRIVRGKWLVQGVLTILTLLSLLPYMLVRYFFGGVELVQNFFTFGSVCAAALGMSGCVLGASGYSGLGMRFVIVVVCAFVLGGTSIFTEILIASSGGQARFSDLMWFGYGYAYALLLHLLYAISGMQLGRAHLKLYLLPYDINPKRTILSLLLTMPFILLAGGVATCGGGAILILLLMIYIMVMYDRPVRVFKGRPWQPGTQPIPNYPQF